MLFTELQSESRIKVVGFAASLVVGIVVSSVMPIAISAVSRPVSLYVTVEKDGGLVTGLREGNFRLFENDQSRSFQLDSPESPASIALLVEWGANYGLFHGDVDRIMQGFMDQAPDGNWYSLVTFSHDLEVNVDFTKEKARITQAYAELGPPGWDESDTYDAIYSMLDKMSRLPGRRVLIVVGSGVDSFSGHTLDDVEKKLESANVTLYAIGLGSMLRGEYEPYLGQSSRLSLLQAEAFLKMLAADSGGEAWLPNLEGAYPDVIKGIMQDLAAQYRLVYNSQVPGDGKLHKLRVDAFNVADDKRTDFKVRVRKGWRF